MAPAVERMLVALIAFEPLQIFRSICIHPIGQNDQHHIAATVTIMGEYTAHAAGPGGNIQFLNLIQSQMFGHGKKDEFLAFRFAQLGLFHQEELFFMGMKLCLRSEWCFNALVFNVIVSNK